MPRLAYWSCGRQVHATSPLESLFVDERRCPRCGAQMSLERRDAERRERIRARNPPHEPGPTAGSGERRTNDRRRGPRRRAP